MAIQGNITIGGLSASSINILTRNYLYVPNSPIGRITIPNSYVGIGTMIPRASLDLRGTIRLVTGNQGNNKVLSSDADGNADWVSLSSIIDTSVTLNDVSNNSINTADSVYQMSDGVDVEFRRSDSSPLLYLDESNNRVGIGTTSPDAKLHVYNNSAGSVTANSDYDDLVIENNSSAGLSILTSNTGRGGITWGTPSDSLSALINFNNSNKLMTIGSYAPGGELQLLYGNAGQAIRIDSSGNVGIGTTSPVQPLHIATNNNNTTLALRVSNDNVGGRAGISFNLPNNVNEYYSLGVDNDRYFKISNGSSLALNTRAAISPSGNVLIGTTTDSGENLQVAGNQVINTNGNTSSTTGFKILNSDGNTMLHVLDNGNVGINIDANTSTSYRLRVDGGIWANSFEQLETLRGRSGVGRIEYYNTGGSHRTLGFRTYGSHPAETVKGFVELSSQVLTYSGMGNIVLHADPDFADHPTLVIRSLNTSADSFYMQNYHHDQGALFITKAASGGDDSIRFRPGRTNDKLVINTNGIEIDGNVHITGALYDSNDSPGTLGQILSSTVTGTDWVSLSDIQGVDGSGTVNYLPVWTDSDTIGNSRVLQDVNGIKLFGLTGRAYTRLQILSPDTGSLALFEITHGADANNASAVIYGRGDTSYPTINSISRGTGVSKSINFAIDQSEKMRIATTGNILIGTTTDAGYKLDVNGTIRSNNIIYASQYRLTAYPTYQTLYNSGSTVILEAPTSGGSLNFNLGGYGTATINGNSNTLNSATNLLTLNRTYASAAGLGTAYGVKLNITFNETGGTKSYVGYFANYIETSFLGTTGNLIQLQRDSIDRFIVNRNGQAFLPTLTNATQTNQVYYDSVTGELTYGSLPVVATPTLNDISQSSVTTTDSIYQMSSGIDVSFRTSALTDILTIRNNDNRIQVGKSGIALPTLSGDVKLYVAGDGTSVTGRTMFVVKNTSSSSAAGFLLYNHLNHGVSIQMSGSSYVVGEKASFGSTHTDLYFSTDGSISTGGTSDIYFQTGGYSVNPFVVYTNTKRVGINNLNPSATLDVVGSLQFETGNQTDGSFLKGDVDGNADWAQITTSDISDYSTPTLQQVTDAGNTTTNAVSIGTTATPTSSLDVFKNNAGNIQNGNDSVIVKGNNPRLKLLGTAAGSTSGDGVIQFSTQDGGDRWVVIGGGSFIIGRGWNNNKTTLLSISNASGGNTAASVFLANANTDSRFSLGFSGTNGTPLSGFTGNGKLYISSTGLATPTAMLQVKGSGTTSTTKALLVENSDAVASLIVRDDGRVGIGTDSPTHLLDVRASAIAPMRIGSEGYYIEITNNTFYFKNGVSWQFGNTYSTGYIQMKSGGGDTMRLHASKNVSIGTTTDAGYKLDVNGTFRFLLGSGTYIQGNSSVVEVVGAYLFANKQSGVSFYAYESVFRDIIRSDSSGGNVLKLGDTQERMRITNGNVLIGTTTDSGYKLDVNGSTRLNGDSYVQNGFLVVNGSASAYSGNALTVYRTNKTVGAIFQDNASTTTITGNYDNPVVMFNNIDNTTNNWTKVYFGSSRTDTASVQAAIGVQNILHGSSGTNGKGDIALFTRNTTTFSEKLRITHDGNVGIGVTTPSATLDVVGTLQFETGNEGADKVLVSDASGNADWQDLSNILKITNYASLNFADDAAADTGGVPLGGIYHTNGTLKVRIT